MTDSTIVHLGSVDLNTERLFTVIKTTRPKVIYELNIWLFDYLRDHNLKIKQLPPLDDWTRVKPNWVYKLSDDAALLNFSVTLSEYVCD